MSRKNNPWVALVALILLLVLVVCICTSCGSAVAEETDATRFIIEVEKAKTRNGWDSVKIITDTETGAQYIFFEDGYAGGLTVLEPAAEKEAEDEQS